MGNYIETYNNLCAKAKAWSAAYYEQDAPVVTEPNTISSAARPPVNSTSLAHSSSFV